MWLILFQDLERRQKETKKENKPATWPSMLDLEILIGKLLSVYRFPTSSITKGEVTTLKHKARNNSMETTPLVMERFATLSNTFLPWNDKNTFVKLTQHDIVNMDRNRLFCFWIPDSYFLCRFSTLKKIGTLCITKNYIKELFSNTMLIKPEHWHYQNFKSESIN